MLLVGVLAIKEKQLKGDLTTLSIKEWKNLDKIFKAYFGPLNILIFFYILYCIKVKIWQKTCKKVHENLLLFPYI